MIERVKLLMSVKNLSSAQLAESIGVQRSGISHILSGRNKPSLDFVLKIIESYPDINETWLLTGKGEMLKKGKVAANLFPYEEKPVLEPTVVKESMVKSEDPPPYGSPKPKEKETSTSQEHIDKESLLTGLFVDKKEMISPPQEPVALLSDVNKKMVKLIAIYNDDSFKVYYPE